MIDCFQNVYRIFHTLLYAFLYSVEIILKNVVVQTILTVELTSCIYIKTAVVARVFWVDAYLQISSLLSLCDILVPRYGLGLSFNSRLRFTNSLSQRKPSFGIQIVLSAFTKDVQ